jgi:hypothetical protein
LKEKEKKNLPIKTAITNKATFQNKRDFPSQAKTEGIHHHWINSRRNV